MTPGGAWIHLTQAKLLPTASAGLVKPITRAALWFSTMLGCTVCPALACSRTMSSPRDREKNRPAIGFRPWSSKKPTSTVASLIVCIVRSRWKMTVLLDPAPMAGMEAQATAFTPRRASTSWRKADRQGSAIRITWLVSSFRAS